MDVVPYQKLVVDDFLRFKSSFTNCLLANLLAQDLKSNEVLSQKN